MNDELMCPLGLSGDSRLYAGIGEALVTSTGSSEPDWSDEPDDLSALMERAPNMPPEMLPEPLRPWIEDVSNRMRVPLEMVAAPCLVAAGALVGRRCAIRPKAYDDWTVVPNLWGCVVAPPGALKSPAMAEALGPFHRLVAAERDRWRADECGRAERRALLELEISALESRLRAAHRPKSSEDTAGLSANLLAKRADLDALAIAEAPARDIRCDDGKTR